MPIVKPLALAAGAAISPFGIVTVYLLGSRLLPDAVVFPLWLGVLILGTTLGVGCLCGLTGSGRRRLVLSVVYVPVMLLTSVVYSFYVTGAILGEST